MKDVDTERTEKRNMGYLLVALVTTMVVLNLLFPGNTPWIKDEPKFIRQAYLANNDGVLAKQVLVGNLGIRYFPLPIWLYQLGLLLTDDLVQLVLIKSCLSLGLTVAGLFLFLHNLRYTWYALLIPLASPFQYLWHRMLWDNGMHIPASSLFVGFLSLYLKQRSTFALVTTTILAVIMLYIHPMATPIVLAGAGTIWLTTWKDLIRDKRKIAAAAATVIILSIPYLWHLSVELRSFSLKQTVGATPFSLITAICRLLSYFSYRDFFDYFRVPLENHGDVWSLVGFLTTFTFVAIFAYWVIGAASAVKAAFREWKSRSDWTPETALSIFAAGSICLHLVMFLFVNKAAMFHYYNATWIGVYIFLARGVTWVNRAPSRWANWVLPTVILSFCFLHIVFISHICKDGGTRHHTFGPTLSAQIDVVKEVQWKPPSSISQLSFEIEHYQWYPNAFGTIYQLYQEDTHPKILSKGKVRIRYVDGQTGHVIVVRED